MLQLKLTGGVFSIGGKEAVIDSLTTSLREQSAEEEEEDGEGPQAKKLRVGTTHTPHTAGLNMDSVPVAQGQCICDLFYMWCIIKACLFKSFKSVHARDLKTNF